MTHTPTTADLDALANAIADRLFEIAKSAGEDVALSTFPVFEDLLAQRGVPYDDIQIVRTKTTATIRHRQLIQSISEVTPPSASEDPVPTGGADGHTL